MTIFRCSERIFGYDPVKVELLLHSVSLNIISLIIGGLSKMQPYTEGLLSHASETFWECLQ